MAIIKQLAAYLVDANNTDDVIASLGSFNISVHEMEQYVTFAPSPMGFSNFQAYVKDADSASNIMFLNSLQGKDIGGAEAYYNAVSEIVRNITPVYLDMETAGTKIKIVNGSGAYAISSLETPVYPGISQIYDLYDKDGNLVLQNTPMFSPYPYAESTVVCLIEHIDENGQASGRAAYASVSANLNTTTGEPVTYVGIYSMPFSAITWLINLSDTTDIPDPFDEGGISDIGGGDGLWDGTSEDIDAPEDVPQLSASDSGFITLYNPTQAQIRALGQYMWSTAFDLNTFKKLFADPMSAILGLSIVPVSIPNTTPQSVTIGNIETGVSMPKVSSQYVTVDCGSITIDKYSGSYLDFSPFTKIELYLPYIGIHPLNADDVMGKTVSIMYRVDVLSGSCVAFVKCGGSVLYTFNGQCSSSIPITGNDWTNVINGAISIAGSIGSMIASNGMTAPMSIPGIASTAVNSLKPEIEKSGSLSGTGGLMSIQKPYIIITRPNQALPKGQNKLIGYPSFISRRLGNVKGFTVVSDIHLENIPATDVEKNEIESLLKSGVIL